ncbi:MAG: zf-HC2 domain-containing protein [Gemmatimonadota bacterium]
MSQTDATLCDQVRTLLVARQLGAAAAPEAGRARQHLAGCPACRSYARVLERLQAETAAEVEAARPDPRIQVALRRALRARPPSRPAAAALRGFLRLRLPAYQVLLGAAAAVALLFAALPRGPGYLDPGYRAAPMARAGSTAVYLTHADSDEVSVKMRRLDSQPRGPGVDTLLSRGRSGVAVAGVYSLSAL